MDSFCKIREIHRAIIGFENQLITEYGLSLNEGMALCCLSKKEALTSTEIAELLDLTCSNTSKVIKSVEKKGWIHRDLGNDDKRNMFFSLTPEGVKKLKEVKICSIEVPEELKCIIKD
ncbi:MAG: MarR family transcriptional regulator [Bacteroidaceae bacterium]|nr:MarR family transcriptional regulator [Bacteroidaceae bacterium]